MSWDQRRTLRRWASTATRPNPPNIIATRRANSGDPPLPPGVPPVLVAGVVAVGTDVAASTIWTGVAVGALVGVAVAPSSDWTGVGFAVGAVVGVGVGVAVGVAVGAGLAVGGLVGVGVGSVVAVAVGVASGLGTVTTSAVHSLSAELWVPSGE